MIQGFEQFASDPELVEFLSKRPEQDAQSFFKSVMNLEKKLGTTINPPAKDAKPEEVKAFVDKVYSTGHIKPPPAIPESPDKYELARPDGVPEEAWDDNLVGELRVVAHKHGITQDALNDILALDAKRFGGLKATLQTDRSNAELELRELWTKEGKRFEEQMELGARAAKHLFSEQEVALLNAAGIGDHPRFLAAVAKVGEAIQESNGIMGGMPAGNESVIAEANDIMSNPQNPKHTLYKQGDPMVRKYVDDLWSKVYGTGETNVNEALEKIKGA